MYKIFIGYDAKAGIASDVAAYSFKKHSSIPLEISYLKLSELNFNRPWDNLQATEFAFSRFLVPYLCNYSNEPTIFVDNDVIVMGDVAEIFNLDMTNYALRVVKHHHVPTTKIKLDNRTQTVYPRKNWSSFYLCRPDRLHCWTKEAVEIQSGAWLHQFKSIPDELIGEMPKTWNVLDYANSDTKMIHYTEGLPIYPGYENHPYAHIWYKYRDEYLNFIKYGNR